MNKHRIKKVFNATTKNIKNKKAPNVKREMLNQGYSESSANAQTVTRTKTWQELLAKYDDEPIMDLIVEEALSREDKRNATDNRKLYLQIKDKFPDKKHKITLYDEREAITE